MVERIDEQGASVIYGWGISSPFMIYRPGYERVRGQFDSERRLNFVLSNGATVRCNFLKASRKVIYCAHTYLDDLTRGMFIRPSEDMGGKVLAPFIGTWKGKWLRKGGDQTHGLKVQPVASRWASLVYSWGPYDGTPGGEYRILGVVAQDNVLYAYVPGGAEVSYLVAPSGTSIQATYLIRDQKAVGTLSR